MNLLLHILHTDPISYQVYGFWKSLGLRLLGFLPYRFRDWWTKHVRTIYAPQHVELRASIPKIWSDLTHVIPTFLYACIVSYVENEDGLTMWEAQESEHPAFKEAPMLREVYLWAKTGRAAEIARIDSLHPSFAPGTNIIEWLNQDNPNRDVAYKRVQEAEDVFDEKDSRYLQWIVSRDCLQSLWT